LNDSLYPFSQGLPGSINRVPVLNLASQSPNIIALHELVFVCDFRLIEL